VKTEVKKPRLSDSSSGTERIVEAYRRACIDRPGGYSSAGHSFTREDVVLQMYEVLLLFRKAFIKAGWDSDALAEKRLLEVGCAWGLRLQQLLGFNTRPDNLYGIDLQDSYIAEARRNHPGIHYAVMSATEMSYADGTFDASFAVMALSAMIEPAIIDASLAEMCRVSRRFVLVIDNFEPSYQNTAEGATFFKGVERGRVEKLASRHDVRAVTVLGSFWTTRRTAWRLVSALSRVGLGSLAYALVVRLLAPHSHRAYLVELEGRSRST
jgi:ubiquinone/menaquinone biosynthesis C-methylase UbiE